MKRKEAENVTVNGVALEDKEQKTVLVLPDMKKTRLVVHIHGDCDLILNKMSDESIEEIKESQTSNDKTGVKKKKEPINMWQRLIGSVHWMDSFDNLPEEMKEYDESGLFKHPKYTKEVYLYLLSNNRIGYDASGIKKGLMDAAIRVLGETKSTVLNANIKIVPEKKNLVEIKYNDYDIDESVITNYKQNAFLTYRNIFRDWSADVVVEYLTDNIERDTVIKLFQAMGFAGGIGAHRVGLKGGTNGSFVVESVQYV